VKRVCETEMKMLALVRDDALIRDSWRNVTSGNRPKLPQSDKEGMVLYGLPSLVMLNIDDDYDEDDDMDYILLSVMTYAFCKRQI